MNVFGKNYGVQAHVITTISVSLEKKLVQHAEKDAPPCPLPFGRGANGYAD